MVRWDGARAKWLRGKCKNSLTLWEVVLYISSIMCEEKIIWQTVPFQSLRNISGTLPRTEMMCGFFFKTDLINLSYIACNSVISNKNSWQREHHKPTEWSTYLLFTNSILRMISIFVFVMIIQFLFLLLIEWLLENIGHALNFEWDVEENEISMVYDSRVKGIKILIS